jgi:hypothetical protein
VSSVGCYVCFQCSLGSHYFRDTSRSRLRVGLFWWSLCFLILLAASLGLGQLLPGRNDWHEQESLRQLCHFDYDGDDLHSTNHVVLNVVESWPGSSSYIGYPRGLFWQNTNMYDTSYNSSTTGEYYECNVPVLN